MLKVSCFFFSVHDFSLEITNENISEHSCPYFFFISMIMILSAFCFPTVPRRTSSFFASSSVPFFNSNVVVLWVVDPVLFTTYFTTYWSAYTDTDINAAHSNKTIFFISYQTEFLSELIRKLNSATLTILHYVRGVTHCLESFFVFSNQFGISQFFRKVYLLIDDTNQFVACLM